MAETSSTFRRLVFAALALVMGTAAGLAIVESGLRYYASYVRSREHMDPGFLVFDRQTGWRMAANWSGRHRNYDFDVTYTTNEQGLRGSWPAAPARPPSGGVRYAFVGDSFTFGLGVADSETFVQQLAVANPSTVYLNAGVAGFSTDQEYLFLKERIADWRLDKMALVVYLANDLLDNTLRYPLQADMGKPLFSLQSGELRLTNVPVPLQPKPEEERRRTLASLLMGEERARAEENSWRNRWQLARSIGLAERADPAALAQMPNRLAYSMDLFVRLTREIRRLCENNQTAMSVILMPGRSYVDLPDSFSAQFQDFLRGEILRRQSELGVPVFDLASELRKQQQRTGQQLFHPHEGHLTRIGHQAVANLLLDLPGK